MLRSEIQNFTVGYRLILTVLSGDDDGFRKILKCKSDQKVAWTAKSQALCSSRIVGIVCVNDECRLYLWPEFLSGGEEVSGYCSPFRVSGGELLELIRSRTKSPNAKFVAWS